MNPIALVYEPEVGTLPIGVLSGKEEMVPVWVLRILLLWSIWKPWTLKAGEGHFSIVPISFLMVLEPCHPSLPPSRQNSCRMIFPVRIRRVSRPRGSNTELTVYRIPVLVNGWSFSTTPRTTVRQERAQLEGSLWWSLDSEYSSTDLVEGWHLLPLCVLN